MLLVFKIRIFGSIQSLLLVLFFQSFREAFALFWEGSLGSGDFMIKKGEMLPFFFKSFFGST